MTKIVAIGGGEIGRPGFPVQTKDIDIDIISFSQKKKPKVLFIPTASSDSQSYIEVFTKYYQKLGCIVDVLKLVATKQSKSTLSKKILSADIIYVGGGNTLKMMKLWRKLCVDEILRAAAKKNIILCGLSAGSICWFKYGNSDSRKFTSNTSNLIRVKGLELIDALHCPHYAEEINRKKSLKEMMKKTPGVGIALDNCSAIKIFDDRYKIVRSNKSAKAYKVFWSSGKFYESEIPVKKEWSLLSELLKK